MNLEPESDYETLIKVRIPEKRAQLIRDILILSIFLLGLLTGLSLLGFVQFYFVCSVRNENVTVSQCLRGDYAWKRK